MKKYLMRGGLSPISSMNISEIVVNNTIGDNSGNLLYLYSVMRSLMTEDTLIDMDRYDIEMGRWDDKRIARINEEYAAYILPLADAFRGDFVNKLKNYTRFFKKVRIPVYLIGVGIRASLDENPANPHAYDEVVKEFLKEILKKSSIVGLRGERTGAYLKGLGFAEEQDYTVIGCPSLYGFGRELGQRELHLTPESRISVNYGYSFPSNIVAWLNKEVMERPGSQFVGQQIKDLWLLYYGFPYHYRDKEENIPIDWVKAEPFLESYPLGLKHPFLQEDRSRFFVDPRVWIENMKGIDLSIGGRFHGSVAAILGGAPAYVICADSRMKELADYHGIPHTTVKEIDLSLSLEQLMNGIDPRIPQARQDACFAHYLDFLRKNGLSSIFDQDPERKNAPLDEVGKATFEEVTNVLTCTPKEITTRVNDHNLLLVRHLARLSDRKLEKAEAECEKARKELKTISDRYDELLGKDLSEMVRSLEDKVTDLEKKDTLLKSECELLRKKEAESREELEKAKLQLRRKAVKAAISAADLGRKVLRKKPIE